MTLRRRLIFQITATIAAIALLSIVAIGGVRGLRQNFAVALAANAQLREVYMAGSRVAIAKAELENEPQAAVGRFRALHALQSAEQLLGTNEFLTRLASTQTQLQDARAAIHLAIASFNSDEAFDATLSQPLSTLANLSAATRQAIEQAQLDADRKHHAIEFSVILLAIGSTLAVIAVGWRQYRSVMRPLLTLQRAVQRFAAGHLEETLAVAGDREFAMLATEFNRMAGELRRVQRDLEQRVEEKSRALVQSERLASVGFLAAGVAHEINNPLSIIAGYGERTLRKLSANSDAGDAAEALQGSIQVMCDEAFRCKQITDRLLQLARPGDSLRKVVSLVDAARDAIVPLSGLRQFSGQAISVKFDANDEAELRILANEGELRQLLLNLLINALDACANQTNGEVRIDIHHAANAIVLSVADNGRGMTAETAAMVFEPFFTKAEHRPSHPRNTGKKDVGSEARAGTGLGLSIVHAIVADHEGSIEALSDGIGKGSTFVVRFPKAAMNTIAENSALKHVPASA